MTDQVILRIDGQVQQPQQLSLEDLRKIEPEHQVTNLTALGYKRNGQAIRLQGLLAVAGATREATHLGLHASADNFHASIPLAPIRERGLLIFSHDDRPLSPGDGGPLRFFIPDHAACRTDEIDECANVKFVDHIELTAGKGYDNRPTDEEEHRRLHAQQQQAAQQ
jgi:DMSO/TMAO reductase YedYZ molybdopterin-dependent catalytic subunit